jgi:hypothetical protein
MIDIRSAGEGYVTVNWKLSFSGLTPGRLLFADSLTSTMESVYNMTEPEALLEDAQRDRDVTCAFISQLEKVVRYN